MWSSDVHVDLKEGSWEGTHREGVKPGLLLFWSQQFWFGSGSSQQFSAEVPSVAAAALKLCGHNMQR